MKTIKISNCAIGFFFIGIFIYQVLAKEEHIWIGAESNRSSELLPYWENGNDIQIEEDASAKITSRDIVAISIGPRIRGANLQLELTSTGWKKLYAMAKKLRSLNKKLALVVHGKVVLLVSPDFLVEERHEDGMGLSIGPIPDKILQELKTMKNVVWYIHI